MVQQLLLSVTLPAVIAAVVIAVIAMRRRGRPVPAAAGAIGVGLGLAVSFGFEAGWSAFMPSERWQWFIAVAGAATVGGAFLPQPGKRRIVTALLVLGVAGAAGGLIAAPGMDGLPIRLGLAASVLVLFAALDARVRGKRPTAPILSLAVVGATMAYILFQSHNAKLSMLAAALTAIAVAVAVITVLAGRSGIGGGVVVYAAVIPTLMLLGAAYDYGDLPRASFALPVAAPLALLLGKALPRSWRRTSVRAGLIDLALVAVPCAVAVALVLFTGEEAATSADPYADLY